MSEHIIKLDIKVSIKAFLSCSLSSYDNCEPFYYENCCQKKALRIGKNVTAAKLRSTINNFMKYVILN